MIEAADTIGWFRSALCSQYISMSSVFSTKFKTMAFQARVFGEGQSMMTFIFSFLSFKNSFIIAADFFASNVLRFVLFRTYSSISFAFVIIATVS